MTDKKIIKITPKKKPPSTDIQSVQFDLFNQFVTNDKGRVSNTVEIWEKIPKYIFTPALMNKLRPEKGQPDPYSWMYEEKGQKYKVVFQPALIEQSDGTYKAFFPSVTEELVEEALKKILTIQNMGIHDPRKQETWVRFSLSMIYKELKEVGRTRDRAQIKQAIAVMSGAVITLYKDKKELWKGTILQDLVTVDREEYLEDTNAHHVARLPLFVSRAINQLGTRQFNYERLMGCDQQLSRWIYKMLINRFKQASMVNGYHFKYSTLKHSGLLQQARETDNRKKVIVALDELIEQSVIYSYNVKEVIDQKDKKTVLDVVYEDIIASSEFISEQKASNKRALNNQVKAEEAGYIPPPVDK